jgi:hypothetical protein
MEQDFRGPSWLTFLGRRKDSLGDPDRSGGIRASSLQSQPIQGALSSNETSPPDFKMLLIFSLMNSGLGI